MSYDIYKIKGSELIDEKARTKIADIKNVAKTGSYKDLDLTGATINTNYTLPNSTNSILGGVKIGEGLSVTNRGVLSAPIIDESLHKTSIQLTKDRKQIININDGDTIILPNVNGEELLTIDVEIHIPWNSDHKSPSVTFPTDIKWVESPRLKFNSWYNYRFMYVKDQWLGGFTEFDVVYDSSMNIFIFDTTKTPNNLTVTLDNDKGGDGTVWDGVTDWGDGTLDTNTSHTYTNDGIYLVKTKYKMLLDENLDEFYDTRNKLIDCLEINKNITDMSSFFYSCNNLTTFDISNFNTTKVTNMNNMFNSCSNLTTLDVSNWDTSNVTDMNNMFSWCDKLTTLDVSNWNTSNVTNMSYMFSGCSLITLDASNWDTSNVTNMYYMFNNCNGLTTLDVSGFDTTKVTNMGSMFNCCSGLTTLNVSKWNTSNVTNMGYMFYGCNKLTTLDISNFNMDKVTDMNNMFFNCTSLHQSGLTMTNCNEATKNKINKMVQA